MLARVEGLSSIQQKIFKNEFLKEIESNDFFSKRYEKNGFEHRLIQEHWEKFLVPKLLSEKEQNIVKFKTA